MNLSTLTLQQLRQLQNDLATEIKIREQSKINEARQKILELAQQAGVSLQDLLGTPAVRSSKPSKPVAVKYRHPNNPALQWTGRGRAPSWVKEWEAEHHSLTGLLVTE